jgi:serine/threonine protein kinase
VFAARDSIKGDLVATGTIGARGSATFAAFVLARVSTSKRPRIGLAVGTQRPAERSASFRRRRRSSNSLDDSAAYSPEFAVHAFEVMVAVGPHALVDPDEVQLVREVGRGAFGVVYSANWRSQVVAVKELACAEGGINSDDVRRELNNLSDLRNQYVVQFYGFTVVRNRIQIITEFFRLGSLEGMLRSAVSRFDEAIPLGLRTRFACDSARGMSYLAGMSVVHRDFKPGNLLVVHTRPEEPSPCCKLTDFGSARSSAVGAEGITSMTKGVGTPIFMAPEILAGGRGVSYTQKTDVFAYGVSLYHIFSGKEPYDGFETMTQVINFVTGGKRLDLAPIAEVTKRSSDGFSELGGVGSAISDLISACWTHEQGSRPTFDDVVSIIAPISEIVVTETTRGNRRIRDLDHPT